jgi:DNA polymerase elongation subunit (family B)
MYSENELLKMVFFDLETSSEYATLEALEEANPLKAKLWRKRCEYLRSRFTENSESSDEQLYLEKAGLTPEFSRIVCASFGRFEKSEDTELGVQFKVTIKSYSSSNEVEVLDGISTVFTKFEKYKFVGHNIKRFDIPMICKRLLINGKSLPNTLMVQNMKPWEIPMIDTSELWSFGAWQEGFTSLELLCVSLGIDTPKDDIKGDQVSAVYWQDGDIGRIETYCEKDVLSCARVIAKLSNFEII